MRPSYTTAAASSLVVGLFGFFTTWLLLPPLHLGMFSMKGFATAVSGLSLAGVVVGQACVTTTLTTTVPSDGTELALSSYSYCGGYVY